MTTRLRVSLAVSVSATALACAAFLLLRPAIEDAARRRLVAEARGLGLSTTLGGVHLTPALSLELNDLVLESAGRVRVSTHRALVSPRAEAKIANAT